MKLSIVIPAYNEQDRILQCLSTITTWLSESGMRSDAEMLVVDDGSADNTKLLVTQFANANPGFNIRTISYRPNIGKGYAVRTGVTESTGELVLITDVDLSAPITEFAKLHNAIELGADIAFGSRALPSSQILEHQPAYREFIGRTYNLVTRILLGWRFHDTQCGFKLSRGYVAREVFATCLTNGFAFDVEFIARALKSGYHVVEIPVIWINSPQSRVPVLSASIKMFLDTLRVRFTLTRSRKV